MMILLILFVVVYSLILILINIKGIDGNQFCMEASYYKGGWCFREEAECPENQYLNGFDCACNELFRENPKYKFWKLWMPKSDRCI